MKPHCLIFATTVILSPHSYSQECVNTDGGVIDAKRDVLEVKDPKPSPSMTYTNQPALEIAICWK